MKNREKIEPFVWGMVVGAIALTIVGFSADWVVTTGSKNKQVQTAHIEAQAAICSSLANAQRKASGDVADLSGYAARETREKLAQAATVLLPGQQAADAGVVRACSDMLAKVGP